MCRATEGEKSFLIFTFFLSLFLLPSRYQLRQHTTEIKFEFFFWPLFLLVFFVQTLSVPLSFSNIFSGESLSNGNPLFVQKIIFYFLFFIFGFYF